MKTITTNHVSQFKQRLQDYKMLVKFRLTLLVVFSAGITFLLANKGPIIDWMGLLWLSLGGFFLSGASNTLNQVLEKNYDKLMSRTSNRPVATGRIDSNEAVLFAGILSVMGILIFAIYFNPATTILGMISLLSYAFVYTPMKRISPISVWIGAIPGALPMAIGWVAVTGTISVEAIYLFTIEFLWQFPHFWAIAWVAYDDYARGGYYMLPTREEDGRNRSTALQAIFYAALLIPMSFLTVHLNIAGYGAMIIMLLAAIVYTIYAIQLYIKCDQAAARKLMFSSFFYLPIVLIALIADKL